jgi:hypothetical protein
VVVDGVVVDGVAVGGRLEAAPSSSMFPVAVARRTFLAISGGVVAAAAVVATIGRHLASVGSSEAERAKVVLPEPAPSSSTPTPVVGCGSGKSLHHP